jgi:hypothetical protein
MNAPRRAPLPYVTRSELAGEFSISENSVDELVRRGVLPNPTAQTPTGPKWSWRLVERALALFESPQRSEQLGERCA